jgi:HD-like signal output (HDOD) protein
MSLSLLPSMPDGTDAASRVESAVARAGQLATLPEVALAIMRLAEDPTSTGDDLERVLSSDPPLSARVLRIVNSAFYGVRREVTSIGTAIVVLGFSAVKNVAVAASLSRMFRVGTLAGHFEARDLWTHSIAVAAASRLVAARVGGVDEGDAFLAGLLHDIGVIVELQACRTEFAAVVAAVAADATADFRDAETRHLGATHEAFGESLCRSWRFPADLQRVCGHHHRPLALATESRRMTAIVHVADHLAAAARVGYTRTVEGAGPQPDVLAWLGLTGADLDALRAALPGLVDDVMPALGMAA